MPKRPSNKTQKQLLVENVELRARLKETEEVLHAIHSGQVDALIVSGTGGERIFTLKQAEDAMAESEEKFRRLVEHLPSIVYMNEVGNPGFPLYVSPHIKMQLGYTQEEWLADPKLWSKAIHKEDRQPVMREVAEANRGNKLFGMEYRMVASDGHLVWVHDQSQLVYDLEGKAKFRQGIMLDITARKNAEGALLESEEKFRRLVEHLPTVVYLNAVGDTASTIYVSPQIQQLLGYTPQEWLADPKLWSKTLHPEDRQQVLAQTTDSDQSRTPFDMEYRMLTSDGRLVWVHDESLLVNDLKGEPQFWQGIMLDITQRKLDEQALQGSEKRFRALVENNSDAITLLDARGIALYDSPAAPGMLGYASEEWIGQDVFALVHPEDLPWMKDHFEKLVKTPGARDNSTFRLRHKSGSWVWIEMVATNLLADPDVNAIVLNYHNISDRKDAEAEIHQRLSELEVLYQSGLALSQLVKPKAIAQKMIDLLDKKMDWHHTAVRLYDPQYEALELLVFNQPNLSTQEEHVVAGERLKTSITSSSAGLSGWVIQHGRAVRSNDLQNDPRYFETFPGLHSGLYVPIKIAERVIGVISIESELVHAFSESDERLAFTLATQAAIAIENAQLFESFKRSNIDLELAYDATIEGWSHALDLRDKETEGHSQRVTDITLNLAQSMGLSREELVHIRRGALLHDIGKMGVPDHILLKPDKLTDEEWEIMKQHPRFAYNLLSPIAYLKPALDIPYCHHEKWDGTGYPRGLSGEQIPLTARIFAVVDVWDALRSDRSYRAAWVEEKVLEHILALSGTHFDPHVVDIFMQMSKKVPDKPIKLISGSATLLES